MNRKLFRSIALLSLGLIIFVLAGCGGGTDVSKSDRLDGFIRDASNHNYSSMTSHVHPDADNRNQLNEAYWENYFPSGETYSVDVSFSADSATGTIESSNGTEYPSGTSITVDFKNDPEDGGFFGGESDNWKIIRLVIGGTTIVQ